MICPDATSSPVPGERIQKLIHVCVSLTRFNAESAPQNPIHIIWNARLARRLAADRRQSLQLPEASSFKRKNRSALKRPNKTPLITAWIDRPPRHCSETCVSGNDSRQRESTPRTTCPGLGTPSGIAMQFPGGENREAPPAQVQSPPPAASHPSQPRHYLVWKSRWITSTAGGLQGSRLPDT